MTAFSKDIAITLLLKVMLLFLLWFICFKPVVRHPLSPGVWLLGPMTAHHGNFEFSMR